LRKKTSTGEYLAFISVKYEVDPDKFFLALIMAEENQKATIGNLTIECRGKTEDKAMFLISKDSKVIAQFSVLKEFLMEQGSPIRSYMDTNMVRRFLARKNMRSLMLPIRDLRIGMRQVSLRAKVLEIPKPKIVYTRYGDYASVANALIADETGTIRLCLWNEQISSIATGDMIQLKNARTSVFRGQRQLCIGKNGSLSSIEEPISPIERSILPQVSI
jgi:replication factor A1